MVNTLKMQLRHHFAKYQQSGGRVKSFQMNFILKFIQFVNL